MNRVGAGKCCSEGLPGVAEAVGEVTGVREEGGLLCGGVDVEAAVAEEFLEEGGVAPAWKNVAGLILTCTYL